MPRTMPYPQACPRGEAEGPIGVPPPAIDYVACFQENFRGVEYMADWTGSELPILQVLPTFEVLRPIFGPKTTISSIPRHI